MNKKIYSVLICPSCKGRLKLINKGDKDLEGDLICDCGKVYPIIQGIPVFKAGVYLRPVVRVRQMSRKQLEVKISEAQSKKYFSKFLWYIRKNYRDYQPKRIIENELLDSLIIHSKAKDSKMHLDWATGRGGLLRYILNKTKIPYLITLDLDIQECAAFKKYIETTRYRKRAFVICGDTRQMPFKDNSFDSLTTLWGVDEQREPNKAIQESIRVLKIGKRMALSGGLEGSSFEEIETNIDKKLKILKTITSKLKLQDFKNEKIKYLFIDEKNKFPVISYLISGSKGD